MKCRRSLAIAMILASSSGLVYADLTAPGPPCVPGEPGRGGVVTEHSGRPNATFIVHLTDSNYHDIPGQDLFPPSLPDPRGGTTIAPINVPAMPGLCDARNETILPPLHGGRIGARADLSIESVFFDASTQKFELLNVWGTIAQQLGSRAVVAIPDLYIADASGSLDDRILYSLVDLSVYVHGIPTFTEGETFNIVDGRTAALPGMFFSTEPFTFDPVTGFTDPAYTGTAIAETQHGFAPVPEPASTTLVFAGLAGMLALGRRWKKPAA
jgi:hypothetical protein